MSYEASIDQDQDKRGWILVSENTYTENNSFIVPKNQRVKLDMGASPSILSSYSPPGSANWWDSQISKFTPDTVGAMYMLRLNALIKSQRNTERLHFELDIGGSQGAIYGETYYTMDKDWHLKSFSMPLFTLDTFVQNGAEFYFEGTNNFLMYDMSLLIQKYWAPVKES